MEMMPVNDLVKLIRLHAPENGIISVTKINKIFEEYADQYYKESSWAPYELVTKNEKRAKELSILNKIPEIKCVQKKS